MKCLLQAFFVIWLAAMPRVRAGADPGVGGRITNSRGSAEKEFLAATEPLFKQYCFSCHGDKKARGEINLERMSIAPDLATLFKNWEKVVAMLEQKEMPPEEKPQPSDVDRERLITTVRQTLQAFIREHEGDPGRVAMRQLTSAEYAYTILDLTRLDLGLEKNFVSDAVGGEGFSNVGDIQFIQDSTLERYLEAAKIVSSHAIIGAGPLRFYRDPGKTGQELSAIRRIQEIYQQHGFRTASGEGGEAFGLEHYSKAFYAAWRFRYRQELGLAEATLESLAKGEGVDAPFVRHIWSVLNDSSLSFPSTEIVTAWRKLPPPENQHGSHEQIREECEKLYKVLQDWQLSLAENTGEAEVATVLTENSFKASSTNSFRIRLAWPEGTTNAAFEISVVPVAGKNAAKPAVLWRNPGLRFRKRGDGGASGKKTAVTPLAQVVSVETGKRLQFGRTASGEHIGTNDFLTLGALVLPIKFAIPAGMAQAELLLDAELDLAKGEDCVVRCIVSHELNEGATVAAISTFSGLLANPSGPEIETLKAGVSEFARKLPQISQREAAPADRDPIPPPFDSGYNNTERNDFHAFVKYHRDDQFLTEHILDDPTRSELDREWADLLTSFEYHNTILRFVAKKYHLDLGSRKIASVGQDWIESLPEEPRRFVKELRKGHASAQRMLQAAEPGHLRDAMRFARLAWRRPLNEAEEERLKNFYRGLREKGINHEESMRALLARILVAPAFLYRMEAPRLSVTRSGHEVANAAGSRGWTALSNWELANRLSYFLWSSIPDVELSRAAERGELEKTEELSRQAKRMLRDPKARRFATEFFGQWFGFYRFDGYRGVDTARFKEFTENLKSSMYDEAVSFFEYIVREDRPVQEILFADYSFLNRDLAAHYGIEGAATPPTNALARIEGVNRFHRGGLLSLGAVLTTTSAPLRTSAVKRGDWMLRRVLGKSIPPPPGDAGSIPPDDVLPDGKTVRQRLEAHRRDASCVNCHSRIDPLGFALEHFDSIGRWRDTYRDGQIIDASGKLSDGTEISEFEGLIEYLHQQEGLFDRTLCAKLLGYALGRAELISDRPLLDRMTGGLRSDSRFSRLVTEIVTSSQFRYQRGEESEGAQSKKVADFRAQ